MMIILGECWEKDQLDNGFHCLFGPFSPIYVLSFGEKNSGASPNKCINQR
jgi:hypothetical protein